MDHSVVCSSLYSLAAVLTLSCSRAILGILKEPRAQACFRLSERNSRPGEGGGGVAKGNVFPSQPGGHSLETRRALFCSRAAGVRNPVLKSR